MRRPGAFLAHPERRFAYELFAPILTPIWAYPAPFLPIPTPLLPLRQGLGGLGFWIIFYRPASAVLGTVHSSCSGPLSAIFLCTLHAGLPRTSECGLAGVDISQSVAFVPHLLHPQLRLRMAFLLDAAAFEPLWWFADIRLH